MAKKGSAGGRRRRKTRRSAGSESGPAKIGDLPGIESDAIRELFEAAREFLDVESRFAETGAFRLDAPAVGLYGVVGSRIDFDSGGTGLLVLPSVDHYRDLTSARERPARDRSNILVVFASPSEIAKATRHEFEKLGWMRSTDGRFPLLMKYGVDGEEIATTTDDYRLATLVATGMIHVVRTAGASLYSEGAAYQCRLTTPEWGDVDVLHPGDLDEDELASIVQERIQVVVRFPEEAIAAARDVEVLSPKARRVLERAQPATASPGHELTASLEELAHVGELLLAASRKPDRPAILGEMAMHLLAASAGPDALLDASPSMDRALPRSLTPPGRSRRASSRVAASKQQRPKRRLVRLKITLRGVRPPIWRRIEMRSDASLAGLHVAIQQAMGWEDCHLHEFECNGQRYGQVDEGFDDFGDDLLKEKATRLDELLKKPKDSLVYRYDFGDDWEHQVVLEAIEPLPPGQRAPRPRCVDGRRACPPEDCGGPGGYARMLEALENPRDPEHASVREWVGGWFDPEAF